MPEYFLILTAIFIVTLTLHLFFKVKIYKSKLHFFVFNLVNLFLATIWDQFAISRGHWVFNPQFLIGIKIGFMPIEEFLFVLTLSYFALTFYKILDKKL